METFVGDLLVWTGLVLLALQVIYTLWATFSKKVVGLAEDANAPGFDKLIGALAEKFPVAALGVASIWLGGRILDWF